LDRGVLETIDFRFRPLRAEQTRDPDLKYASPLTAETDHIIHTVREFAEGARELNR
jgi:hypothetical protein